jgi:hypothetical protein
LRTSGQEGWRVIEMMKCETWISTFSRAGGNQSSSGSSMVICLMSWFAFAAVRRTGRTDGLDLFQRRIDRLLDINSFGWVRNLQVRNWSAGFFGSCPDFSFSDVAIIFLKFSFQLPPTSNDDEETHRVGEQRSQSWRFLRDDISATFEFIALPEMTIDSKEWWDTNWRKASRKQWAKRSSTNSRWIIRVLAHVIKKI